MSRSSQPFGDTPGSGGIPLFNKHGTALSASERKKMAARKGLCVQCGMRTHDLKGVVRRVAVNNDDVYKGTCIRCNQSEVPSQIYAKWEAGKADTMAKSLRGDQVGAAARAAGFSTSNLVPEGSGSDRTLKIARQQDSSRSHGSSGDDSFDPNMLVPTKKGSSGDLHSSFDHLDILKRQGISSVDESLRHLPEGGDSVSSLSHLSLLKKKSSRESSARTRSDKNFSVGARSERDGFGSGDSINSQRISHEKSRSYISSRSSTLGNDDFTGGPFADDDPLTVVKGMRGKRDDPEALKHYLHRLRNLGEEQVGALFEVKDVMDGFPNEARLLAVACGAVWGLVALDDDAKIQAYESGVLKSIVDALRNSRNRGNDDFVQWAMGALACLARGSHNKANIAKAGGVGAVIDALDTHKDSAGVFEWACRALHSFVYQYDDEGDEEYSIDAAKSIERNIALIEENAGHARVVDAMDMHPSESVAQGWAIKFLLRMLDQKGKNKLSNIFLALNEARVIPACAHVLSTSSTTPDVFCYAAELIAALIPEVRDGGTLLHATSEQCIPVIARMMKVHSRDEALQEACCQLLEKLVRSSRLLLTENRVLGEVIAAMAMYTSNISIQESGARILWSMSFIKAFYDTSLTKDAILAMGRSTKEFSDSVALHSGACGFIANVSVIEDTRMSDIPLDMPFRALRSLIGDDSMVADQACRALTAACTRVPEKIDRFMGSDDVRSLVEIVKKPKASTFGVACQVLTTIARTKDKNRLALVEMGALDAAVDTLKLKDLAGGKKHAMVLVASLVDSSRNEETKGSFTAFTGSGANDKVRLSTDLRKHVMESVLDEGDDEFLVETCGVLAAVLHGLDPSSESPIEVDLVVRRMASLLEAASTSVGAKKAACDVLWLVVTKYPVENADDLRLLFTGVVLALQDPNSKGAVYTSDLQLSAAGALGAITDCIRESSAASVAISSEAMDKIVGALAMAIEKDKLNIDLIERLLFVLVNLSAIVPNIVTQCGGIVLGIDTMHDYETYERVQEQGCAMLALLSGAGNLQSKLCITETDGIDTIVGAIVSFSCNERIQMASCACLSQLSEDEESRSLMTSQGVLTLLCNAVGEFCGNLDLVDFALTAMANLVTDADEQLLSTSNVLETTIDIMKKQKNALVVQERGLDLLKSLSMRSKDYKRSIAKSGGVDAVVSVVRDYVGSPSVLGRAFTTMWSLAVLDYNQMSIGRKNGINPVLNGMLANIDDNSVQQQGCGCLCALATNSDNKTAIRDAGGVDAIVYAMWANYAVEQVQAEACRVLSSLAFDMETNEVMLAGEGEINAIISAMRHFPNSERVQGNACAALRNFMLSADNVELIRGNAEELMTLLMIAASNFPEQCAEFTEDIMDSL